MAENRYGDDRSFAATPNWIMAPVSAASTAPSPPGVGLAVPTAAPQ
jgi:hypothetical protein